MPNNVNAASLAEAVRSLAIQSHRALRDPEAHAAELCTLLARVTRLRARLDAQIGGELRRWLDAVRGRILAAMNSAAGTRSSTEPALRSNPTPPVRPSGIS